MHFTGNVDPRQTAESNSMGGALSITVTDLSSDVGKTEDTAEKSEIRHMDDTQTSARNGFKITQNLKSQHSRPIYDTKTVS